jgi:hypothetical protein
MHHAQIECNAPLAAISTRVEKEPPANSAVRKSQIQIDDDGGAPSPEERQQPERIFFPLPRAHETAVAERERTLQRIEEKQSRIDTFLQRTKARVTATECSLKVVAKAEAILAQEKTRRRLDQSVSLIPKPSSALHAKRSRENDADVRRSDCAGKGRDEARGNIQARSAKDIACELGDDILTGLAEARVRESVLPLFFLNLFRSQSQLCCCASMFFFFSGISRR